MKNVIDLGNERAILCLFMHLFLYVFVFTLIYVFFTFQLKFISPFVCFIYIFNLAFISVRLHFYTFTS